ncbi:signal peptide peptidase-like 2B isoform X1 [Pelobates cultripes]|uniref:Signal peptide peptidase-like 2B n=1 Tax=Pelobates cultripes TaxID=61616 RepID=A0AAD1S8N7_PELCU|nr:signal peptide peptidase-like 2B isoform X1 [Pelobates cultripes]
MKPLGFLLAWGFLVTEVLCTPGMMHVISEKSSSKDYCILFNPLWASLPQDLAKAALLQLEDQTTSVLCSPTDVPDGGFNNRILMVMRGNCTFYEKVRLAQINGARGLLIVSRERLVPPGGNRSQYEEIDIPVALLSHSDMIDIGKTFGRAVKVAMYAPKEPVVDYNMVIIFVMAVGTVAIGGYWAGSRDVKKRYMKHKRDDGADKKHDDETVDVTPIMICVFVVMCCSMLVLLYYFYDNLVYVIIGIFCLAASIGLYSCLSPFVRRLPYTKCRVPDNSLPYFHKRPAIWKLVLASFCIAVSVIWGVYRNEDQWAWVLQDILGIAFCLYMLKTIRLPTFKGCTLLLVVLFVYDVFFVFITPFLTKTGESIMVEVAAGPTDSSTQEKLPMVLKVPRLNSSPLALCDRPFSLLGFGDILVPGLLVAYCHRFDIQMQSSRIYFVACTIAYGIGLLVTFLALALMQKGQPALLYLVPCTLLTSLAVAVWRKELPAFWTGSGFVKDLPQPPLVLAPCEPDDGLVQQSEEEDHENEADSHPTTLFPATDNTTPDTTEQQLQDKDRTEPSEQQPCPVTDSANPDPTDQPDSVTDHINSDPAVPRITSDETTSDQSDPQICHSANRTASNADANNAVLPTSLKQSEEQ